ncbi:MAG: hypothetical protein E5W90_14085 [Mesorhizobium sp.]|nr:MAG: hypothetical protein E5W90_14085 [Mesorhizobium sp.]
MANAEHPLKVAALAAVGTFGVLTAIVTQWVLPTVTASLSHDIDVLKESLAAEAQKNKELQSENAALLTQVEDGKRALEIEKSALKPRYEAYSKELVGLKEQISALRLSSLFTPENPYPLGFDGIRIGDPIDKIYEAYRGKNIEKLNTLVSVDTGNEPFLRLIFQHSRTKETAGKVVSITFSYQKVKRLLNSELPRISDHWLEDSLVRNLGKPYVVGPENDCLLWRPNRNEVVYYVKGTDDFDVSGFVVMPPGCDVSDEQMKQLK